MKISYVSDKALNYDVPRSSIYSIFSVLIFGRYLVNNIHIDIELIYFCSQQCVLLMRFYLVKIRQDLDSLPDPGIKSY